MSEKRVVVGLSGGVDSSVAALLLKRQGYDVIGLFMHNWRETEGGACTAEADYTDVRRVADKIGIPYYTMDFSEEYMKEVFSLFLDEYAKGRTPNPDVLCNRHIKFGYFKDFAAKLGAEYIATGHYASIIMDNGRVYLRRARDENKDQTYFLNQLTNSQIQNVLFPLADLEKPEVRRIAAENGLATAGKKDSTGICFIGERNFRKFLSEYIPMREGDIKTLDGRTVGRHEGIYYYTVGQRKGFGIGGKADGNGEPWFVVSKDAVNNILYVNQGECPQLYSSEITAENFNAITDPLREGQRVLARIRHRQPLISATAHPGAGGEVKIVFDEPVRGAAAGQYAVLYDGQICLGGGVIK